MNRNAEIFEQHEKTVWELINSISSATEQVEECEKNHDFRELQTMLMEGAKWIEPSISE